MKIFNSINNLFRKKKYQIQNNELHIYNNNQTMLQEFTNELVKADYLNTIPFIPPIKYGKVIKVYDGDTITIASKLFSDPNIYRFTVRLNGIDSPEIKGKTETEKLLAKQSRDALHEMLFGKIVELKNIMNEKYGRLLCDVYLDDLHINKWMLDNNYAVEYNGGRKDTEWI